MACEGLPLQQQVPLFGVEQKDEPQNDGEQRVVDIVGTLGLRLAQLFTVRCVVGRLDAAQQLVERAQHLLGQPFAHLVLEAPAVGKKRREALVARQAHAAPRRRSVSPLSSCSSSALSAPSARIPPGGELYAQTSWRGLVVAPEQRCSPYDADDYRYPQSVEDRIVDDLGGVYGQYTGRWFASESDTDIEPVEQIRGHRLVMIAHRGQREPFAGARLQAAFLHQPNHALPADLLVLLEQILVIWVGAPCEA